MLTPQNRKLLDSLETKYVTLLAVVSDIARIEMGDAAAASDLEQYICEQQQDIHQSAGTLRREIAQK